MKPVLLLCGLLVALGAGAFVMGEAGESAPVPARGAFWKAVDAAREMVSVERPAEGLLLQPGEQIHFQNAASTAWIYRSFGLGAERAGGQSSYLELRFDGLELVLVPSEPVVAFLTEAGPQPRELAHSETPGAPAGRFELDVRLDGPRVSVVLDGREILGADAGRPLAASAVTLWADGLRVHALRASGGNGEMLYDVAQDVAELAPAREPGRWRVALLWVTGALLAALAYLRSLCDTPPRFSDLARTMLLFLALPAAVVGLHALWPLPSLALGLLVSLGAVLGLAAAAWHLSETGSGSRRAPPRLGKADLVRALLVASVLGLLACQAAEQLVQARLTARSAERARWETSVAPQAFTLSDPLPLDAGNALEPSGTWRNLRLAARVRLEPDSLLELRLRAQEGSTPRGVALCLSSDPRLPSSFCLETDFEFVPVGSSSAPLADTSVHELEVEVVGPSYRARLDGQQIAAAEVEEMPAGGVLLLAAAGHVQVEGCELAALPLDAPAEPGLGATRLPGVAPLGLLVALAVLAVAALRRPYARALTTLSFALLPLAVGFSQGDERGELSVSAWGWTAAAAALVVATYPLAVAHGARRPRAAAFVLGGVLACLGTLRLVAGLPAEAAGPTAVRQAEFAGERLVDGLVHFQHPGVRRLNTWLRDHLFRGQRFTEEKPPGAARVLSLGSSSTWGHGIPEASRLDYPTQLGELLRGRGRQVEVINGAVCATSAARLLRFFREVLLRFEPDVVTLSLTFNDAFHVTQFDEDPYLDLITSPSYVHDAAAQEEEDRVSREGKDTLRALLRAFSTDRDPLTEWRDLVPDPAARTPPERFAATLRRYAELCREEGVRLVLIKEPLRGDVPRLWKEECYAALDAVAQEFGLPVVDPRAALDAAGGEALFMDEIHPLPDGCAVIARELVPVIEALLP